MSTKYTKEQFSEAAKRSLSWAGLARELGLTIYGSTNGTLKRYAQKWSVDTSHFTGQGHLKGKTHAWSTAIPLEEVLVAGRFTNRTKLKKRLLVLGMLSEVCAICNQGPEWNRKPLVLVLDHINGTNDDNRIENLRLLCPNCNSQEPTFTGRNKKHG